MPYQQTPSAGVLVNAFAKVAAQLGFSGPVHQDGVHVRNEAVAVQFAGDAFDVLARRFAADPPPPPNAPTPQVLANTLGRYARYVAEMDMRLSALTAQQPQGPHHTGRMLLANFAMALAGAFAATDRHIVEPLEEDAVILGNLLYAETTGSPEAFMHLWLGLGHPLIPANRAARRRLFISTPLTKLPDAARHELNIQVIRTHTMASEAGYVVTGPDPMLTNNTVAHPEQTHLLAEAEQDLIAQSDVVICLGCDVDSWGQSRTVTWAEKSGAAVAAVGAFPPTASRILEASTHRTTHLHETFDEAFTPLRRWLYTTGTWATGHAARRTAAYVRSEPFVPLALSALDALDPHAFDASDITRQRAYEIVRYPSLQHTATEVEREAMRAALGETADALFSLPAFTSHAPHSTKRDQPRQRVLTKVGLADLDSAADVNSWTEHEKNRLIHLFVETPVPSTHEPFVPASDLLGWETMHRRSTHGCSCPACR